MWGWEYSWAVLLLKDFAMSAYLKQNSDQKKGEKNTGEGGGRDKHSLPWKLIIKSSQNIYSSDFVSAKTN